MVRVLVVMGIVDPIHVKGLMLKVKLGTHVSTLRGFYHRQCILAHCDDTW